MFPKPCSLAAPTERRYSTLAHNERRRRCILPDTFFRHFTGSFRFTRISTFVIPLYLRPLPGSFKFTCTRVISMCRDVFRFGRKERRSTSAGLRLDNEKPGITYQIVCVIPSSKTRRVGRFEFYVERIRHASGRKPVCETAKV